MTSPGSAVAKPPVDPAIGAAIDVYRRMDTIRNVLAPDLNDQELQLFAIVAERSRLDPFAKQIYAIKRKGRVTFQTGIDGFRSSAEETNEYRGSDEPEYGAVIEKPFPHPEWAKVVVHRQFANGEWLHQPATVYFDEMYPGDEQGFQWRKMPRVMLGKCAEAAAFRKAFPKRFSDVYTPEEMDQAAASEMARPVGPTARERVAERRAVLEATIGDPPGSAATVTANESGPCPIRSPRGALCDHRAGHDGDHKRANTTWPTPAHAERAAVSDDKPRQEAAPVAGHDAGADLTQAAEEIFEGEIVNEATDPVPDDVQAGLDLISPTHTKGGR